MELFILVSIFVKNEFIHAFEKEFEQLVRASNKEEGCLLYEPYKDREDPCRIILLERWLTSEALEVHKLTEHYKKHMGHIRPMLIKPPELIVLDQLNRL